MRGFPWTRRRLAVSGLVALGLVVLACETPAPSPVEVETTVVEQEVPAPAGTLKLRAGTEGADPLLVVDGVLVSGRSLGDLDRLVAPDYIARIEVIKGAAARQVYGERGANGVIHITTKSGEAKGPPPPPESAGPDEGHSEILLRETPPAPPVASGVLRSLERLLTPRRDGGGS